MADEEIIPNVRISSHEPVVELLTEGFQDRDNFVRNLVTVLLPGTLPVQGGGGATTPPPLSGSAIGRAAAIPLDMVKQHLRIEPSQTVDDSYLVALEMAAHIHTENVLRRSFDDSVGENIKVAMLLLIAHWYRNREAVAEGDLGAVPLAYMAILAPERSYADCYS